MNHSVEFTTFISFSAKTNPGLFERSEIIALINTINRLSESLRAVDKFRKIYQAKTNPSVSIHTNKIRLAQSISCNKLIFQKYADPEADRKQFGLIDETNNTFKRVVSSTHESLTRCVSVACRWAAYTMEKYDIPVPQILKTFSTL
jgi:hypothetical protein